MHVQGDCCVYVVTCVEPIIFCGCVRTVFQNLFNRRTVYRVWSFCYDSLIGESACLFTYNYMQLLYRNTLLMCCYGRINCRSHRQSDNLITQTDNAATAI